MCPESIHRHHIHGVGVDDDELIDMVVVDVESNLSRPVGMSAGATMVYFMYFMEELNSDSLSLSLSCVSHHTAFFFYEPAAISVSLIARRMMGFQATR